MKLRQEAKSCVSQDPSSSLFKTIKTFSPSKAELESAQTPLFAKTIDWCDNILNGMKMFLTGTLKWQTSRNAHSKKRCLQS